MSTSYPVGYNADGELPLIIIYDIDGVEQFRWEPDQLVASPPGTRDFKLGSWFVHMGVNTDHGLAEILIDDRNNALTESVDLNRECKIKNGWEILIKAGKSVGDLHDDFVGVINEPEVIRPGSKEQQILISAAGWGINTAYRVTRIRRYQEKDSGGLIVDATDVNAKVSEIFKDVLEDTDHLAHQGLGQIGITVTDVDDIDIKLPDFQREFHSFGLSLSELANIAGALYGVDSSKNAFLRRRNSTDSGFLISNHLDPADPHYLLTKNWDQTKLMILRNKILSYKDSTIGFGNTHIHGIGSQHDTLDIDKTASNAVFDLNSDNLAIPFTTTRDNVSKVALFLSKVGTVDKSLHVCIIGEDGAGAPNIDDLRKRVVIQADRLDREVTTGGNYFEVGFDKIPATSREKLFIQIDKYPDSGELRIDYQTGSGTYYTDADKVPPWTAPTGDMRIRTYHSKTMHIIGTNTVAAKKLRTKEAVFSMIDFPNEESALVAMEALLEVHTKRKRIYSPLIVSVPTNKIPLAKTVRLLDKFNGLDQTVDIIGFDKNGSAYDGTARGINDCAVHVESLLI